MSKKTVIFWLLAIVFFYIIFIFKTRSDSIPSQKFFERNVKEFYGVVNFLEKHNNIDLISNNTLHFIDNSSCYNESLYTIFKNNLCQKKHYSNIADRIKNLWHFSVMQDPWYPIDEALVIAPISTYAQISEKIYVYKRWYFKNTNNFVEGIKWRQIERILNNDRAIYVYY